VTGLVLAVLALLFVAYKVAKLTLILVVVSLAVCVAIATAIALAFTSMLALGLHATRLSRVDIGG
jgi:hypothetical protein